MLMNPVDEAWVKELYKYNAPKMYKVALRRLEDAELAQDIVQEAFLALVEKIDIVKSHPNPAGWLMKAVRFLILQAIDTNQNRTKHEVEIDEQVMQFGAPPEQVFSLRDMLPPGLTQREQDLLVWFYEDGQTYEEISARLKIPILTCRTQMFRAKKHYRRLSEKETDYSELM